MNLLKYTFIGLCNGTVPCVLNNYVCVYMCELVCGLSAINSCYFVFLIYLQHCVKDYFPPKRKLQSRFNNENLVIFFFYKLCY